MLQDVMGKTFAWAPKVKQRCSLANLLSLHGGLQPLRSSWVSEPQRSPVCCCGWGTTPGFEDFAPFDGWFRANHICGRVCSTETFQEGIVPIALCVLSLLEKRAWSWVFQDTPNKGRSQAPSREHLHLQDGAEPQSCVKGSAVKWVPR